MNQRKICIVTTTRAEYGLLRWLMQAVRDDEALDLQLVITGMHLAPEFGMTANEIEADGFHIDRRVEMLLASDSEASIAKSMGVAMISFAETLKEMFPHIIVLLGDRFEIVPVALTAVVLGIPLAHIHGGETSQGAIDEAFRHAVTKLATLHFPATEDYRKRIIQMGEDPHRVFNFGAPGLDAIYHLPLLNRDLLEKALQFDLQGRVAVVTYHPVTVERGAALAQIENLLRALEASGIRAVITKANADAGGRVINRRLAEFCQAHAERFKLFDSLGQQKYLSCLKNLDLMIGNSSSGFIEAPSFSLPVVNIGERQKGRTKAANIIDVSNDADAIKEGIAKALSPGFVHTMRTVENLYDRFRDGNTSIRIKDKLKTIELSERLLKKPFHDLAWES